MIVASLPAGILAVVRAPDAASAITIARGVALAGVDAVEITLTVPDAIGVLERLATELNCPVGAGTVRSAREAELVARAGARFVVAPDFDPDVLKVAHGNGVPYVPGALTPSEVGRCLDHGADAIKLFPVSAVGGPGYVRTLSEPFPGTAWVVSGGITVNSVGAYREAGTHSVCLGGALIDRAAAAAGDVAAIAAHARRALQG